MLNNISIKTLLLGLILVILLSALAITSYFGRAKFKPTRLQLDDTYKEFVSRHCGEAAADSSLSFLELTVEVVGQGQSSGSKKVKVTDYCIFSSIQQPYQCPENWQSNADENYERKKFEKLIDRPSDQELQLEDYSGQAETEFSYIGSFYDELTTQDDKVTAFDHQQYAKLIREFGSRIVSDGSELPKKITFEPQPDRTKTITLCTNPNYKPTSKAAPKPKPQASSGTSDAGVSESELKDLENELKGLESQL